MTGRPFLLAGLTADDNAALDVLNAVAAHAGEPRAQVPTGPGNHQLVDGTGAQVDHGTAVRLATLGLVHHDRRRRRVQLTQAGALAQLGTLADWHAAPFPEPALVDRCAAEAARLALAAGWPTELIDLRIRPLLELGLSAV